MQSLPPENHGGKGLLRAERVFLVGFMCSGKSSVGRLLAKRLGWRFIDLDKEIEEREGISIPEIFEQRGEEHFRELEMNLLRELSGVERAVISTGGGLGANPDAMELMMEKGLVVWLEVSFENFWRRCSSKRDRPLLKLGREGLEKLMEERGKIYSMSHLKVEDEGSIQEKAERIISFLSS